MGLEQLFQPDPNVVNELAPQQPAAPAIDINAILAKIKADREARVAQLGGSYNFGEHPIKSILSFLGNVAGGFNERYRGITDPRLQQIRDLESPNFDTQQALGQVALQNAGMGANKGALELAAAPRNIELAQGATQAQTAENKAQARYYNKQPGIEMQRNRNLYQLGKERNDTAQAYHTTQAQLGQMKLQLELQKMNGQITPQNREKYKTDFIRTAIGSGMYPGTIEEISAQAASAFDQQFPMAGAAPGAGGKVQTYDPKTRSLK